MRRIDGMDLEDEIGNALKRRVGFQGGDHILRRANMDIERPDEISVLVLATLWPLAMKRSALRRSPISAK